MRRCVTAVLLACACLLGAAPATAAVPSTATARSATAGTSAPAGRVGSSENPVPVPPSEIPPAGRRLSADRVLEIADRLAKVRHVRAENPGSYGGAYLKGPVRWQVSYFSRKGKEIGQVIIADVDGRVLEQWTGFQVAWTMARGYPGAFGRHVNALYIWLPLCVLFLVPFIDWRRPFALRHLDLLALLSFSVSLAFFNHADIYASVPLVYPPLVYLLVRMLLLLRRGGGEPLRLSIPAPWLAVGVVFLVGFRVGLNVTDSNVIDVGYAGVIGAQRIVDGRALYGGYPASNEHGDTYGPVNYEAYVPFEQAFGWSGTWDDLPAAHATAIVFDLLAVALLFLLGLRLRGPPLGVALAYAWVSYPFTLYALESNSNDMIVAVLLLAVLLCAASPPARGAFAALAGLTKLAPLALAPLFATYGLRDLPARRGISSGRARALGLFVLAFLATAAVASIPALAHDSLHTIYERTFAYQANRGSPFSVWGLYGGLSGAQQAVQIAAVVLALALAVVPLMGGPPAHVASLAAAAAAILIALQLGVEHWFYLYIPWFFPLVMVALLTGRPGLGLDERPASGVQAASGSAPSWRQEVAVRMRAGRPTLMAAVASAPARSSRPAAAASSG